MAIGESSLRKAIKWIDDQMRDRPDADRVKLIDEAGRMFDLTPLDQDFLFRHFASKKS
jgi:hypothetical protein